MAALLEAQGLSFSYRKGAPVFSDVSFSVEPGQILSLLGPNGAGKSTLLNCLAGIAVPSEGRVLLQGAVVSDMTPRAVARLVAYVPQHVSTTYAYSVREYLAMGAAPHLGLFRIPDAEVYRSVDAVVERLNLGGLADRTISHLSGGERQRVAIGRAIVQRPAVILFDEPTSALDYGNQIRVLRAMRDLAEESYAIVMTTHNPDHPLLLGGDVALLDRDGSLDAGPAEEVLTEDRLSDLYGADLRMVRVAEVDRMACLSGKL